MYARAAIAVGTPAGRNRRRLDFRDSEALAQRSARAAVPGAAQAAASVDTIASPCACGGGCPRCGPRRPRTVGDDEASAQDSGIATAPPSIATREGDGSGGTGSGGTGSGSGSGGSGAPPARRARLKSGPTYKPNGTLAPDATTHRVAFESDAAFDQDPDAGVFASCGEVRQEIKWDRAAADSFEAIRGKGRRSPNNGFPDDAKPDVWIEDRGNGGERVGHRADAFNQRNAYYADAIHYKQDKDGPYYHGTDNPGGSDQLAGHWSFRLSAADVCNDGKTVGGSDSILIDWKAARKQGGQEGK